MAFAHRRRPDWRTTTLVLGGVLLLYYLLPLLALVLAQPPGAVLASITRPYVLTAAGNSLLTASASAAVATAFGLPLSYWLARADVPGEGAVVALVALPLVLPPVVSGMLLLEVFGPGGLGGLAAGTGISFTRSLLGVVLAQTFVASPFLVITAKAAFEGVDRELEQASRSLGKDRWTTLRSVTLPLAWPGILAGVTLTFARSLGEFGATIMMAYYPRTMPVQIWVSYISTGLDAALPIGVVLLAAAVAAIVTLTVAGRTPWG